MKAHTNLLKDIMRTAPANVRLFQNDNGSAKLMDGRWVKFGLCPGSGDLVGMTQIRGVAVFTSVEAKTGKDIVRPKQKRWRAFVQKMGGIAIVCRSVEECWRLHHEESQKIVKELDTIYRLRAALSTG